MRVTSYRFLECFSCSSVFFFSFFLFSLLFFSSSPFFTDRGSELAAYEVCFTSQWEPYYVVSKEAPLYDERFLNQGGDKQEHAVLLNAEGYRFFVVRDHFIYHLDHFSSFKWPGGELRSGSLQDVFNIYSHFHPEMEAQYGMGYRNPSCKVFFISSFCVFLL